MPNCYQKSGLLSNLETRGTHCVQYGFPLALLAAQMTFKIIPMGMTAEGRKGVHKTQVYKKEGLPFRPRAFTSPSNAPLSVRIYHEIKRWTLRSWDSSDLSKGSTYYSVRSGSLIKESPIRDRTNPEGTLVKRGKSETKAKA